MGVIASVIVLVGTIACGDTEEPPAVSPVAAAPTPAPTTTPVPPATPSPSPTVEAAPDTEVPTPVPPEPTPAPAADVEVASNIERFTLEVLTVSVGTRVTWSNRDGVSHTSTSGSQDGETGLWDSPTLATGDTFAFTFDEEGKFPYFCRVHPSSMKGVVTVVAQGQQGAVSTPQPAQAMAKAEPTSTAEPPTSTVVPPTPTEVGAPPTPTVVPPSPTAVPTAAVPSATAEPTSAPISVPTPTTVPATATPPPPTSTPAPTTFDAPIANFAHVNVSVPVGTTVIWENQDNAPHTTTSGDSPDPSNLWDSGVLNIGEVFQLTFEETGVFPYFCTQHPFMTATITVTEAGTQATAGAAEAGQGQLPGY